MSFYEQKFQNLTFLQRRKKILYILHRALKEDIKIHEESILEMVNAINFWESRQWVFESSKEGVKKLYEFVLAEVKENDPYQESISFDAPKEERTLLPHKVGVLLENIRSPFNVGAFFRMSEAFGVHEIIIIGPTPSPKTTPKIWKTAKGVLLPFRLFETLTDFLAKEPQSTLIGFEKAKGSKPLDSFSWNFTKDLYLVFGNEEFGIPPSTLSACESFYHIPMMGAKNSLNVSVAGGIILQHLAKMSYKTV